MRRLKALWTLGIAFFKLLIVSLFVPRKGGRAWLGRLRTEGLTSTPAVAWENYAKVARCIGCGMCDVVTGTSVYGLIMSAGRMAADAPLLRREADRLDEVAGEVAKICPTRVDTRALATLLRAQADFLERT